MTITPLMPVYPRCGVRPVRGEGVYLYGERGEKYLDFAAGIAVNALGHGHPKLVKAIAGPEGTGADLLIRCKSTRPLPRLETLTDRSWRSVLGGVPIRVIDAQVAVTLSGGGHRIGHYRLITTLLDPRRHPA